jgi:hypothetical protein
MNQTLLEGGKESFSVKKYNIHEKNNDSNQLLKGDSYTQTPMPFNDSVCLKTNSKTTE